ncbi:MAG: acyltransferase [Methylococcaceae bacterium]
MINIHPSAKISPLSDIEDSMRGSQVNIGALSMVDSFVKIKFSGGIGDVIIGSSVYINSGCVLYSGNGIKIGDNVAIAANVVFAPVNHEFNQKGTLIREQGFKPSKGGILIEDDVWIGAGSILLDGSILRQGCVIGAMSLVRGEVPAYSIHVGNPMQLLGWRK